MTLPLIGISLSNCWKYLNSSLRSMVVEVVVTMVVVPVQVDIEKD